MQPLDDLALPFIRQACTMLPGHPFAVRLPDGAVIEPEDQAPRFTLVLKHPELLAKLAASADWRTLGEAYMRDELDVVGDMEAVYPVAELLQERFGVGGTASAAGLAPFAAREESHSKARDAAAVEYHYDQSNRLFELVTDPTLNYSSACFYAEGDTLEAAQRSKMDRVCRKAGLRAGMRVLDIGCGWGSVLSFAAGAYDLTIHGVTISKAQAEFVRARLQREGIAGRASVEVCDYRDADASRPYDAIISLGMVEHVGVQNLPVYFAKAFELLRPGGVFVMQGVSSSVTEARTEGLAFTHAYLFPDADMPYLTQYLDAAQRAGFEVRDLENLREHYAWTHRAWRQNLERNEAAIVAEVGQERYRALRILYSYATHYFLRRKCSVYQCVLWKPAGDRPELPLRREV